MIEDGYRTQQATKPQTLSYAMMDSPVGVAAWIIEKMRGWSDIKNNDIESVYSKDTLLSNIMIYLVTKTFNSPNGESKTLQVELFTWEKLDFVEKIKQKLNI